MVPQQKDGSIPNASSQAIQSRAVVAASRVVEAKVQLEQEP